MWYMNRLFFETSAWFCVCLCVCPWSLKMLSEVLLSYSGRIHPSFPKLYSCISNFSFASGCPAVFLFIPFIQSASSTCHPCAGLWLYLEQPFLVRSLCYFPGSASLPSILRTIQFFQIWCLLVPGSHWLWHMINFAMVFSLWAKKNCLCTCLLVNTYQFRNVKYEFCNGRTVGSLMH